MLAVELHVLLRRGADARNVSFVLCMHGYEDVKRFNSELTNSRGINNVKIYLKKIIFLGTEKHLLANRRLFKIDR